jgi:hypothetical protein
MQSVLTTGVAVRRVVAAALVTALALTSTARFEAESPGATLDPVGDSGALVQLVQGHRSILWNSLAGTVEVLQIIGWPGDDGATQIGGALMIEKVDDVAGVINFGERPMSLQFDVSH